MTPLPGHLGECYLNGFREQRRADHAAALRVSRRELADDMVDDRDREGRLRGSEASSPRVGLE